MGRWHREKCKCLRHLAVKVLLTSVLLYGCFCGMSIRCNANLDSGQESERYEGSTTVRAYVSMEPEKPSDRPDESEKSKDSDTEEDVKTGDGSKVDLLICIAIGSFGTMVYGIIRLDRNSGEKKGDEC